MLYASTSAALAVTVILLALYRWFIAWKRMTSCTWLITKQGAVQKQTVVARELYTVDSWGKTLSVVTVLYGLALGVCILTAHGKALGRSGWTNAVFVNAP